MLTVREPHAEIDPAQLTAPRSAEKTTPAPAPRTTARETEPSASLAADTARRPPSSAAAAGAIRNSR